MSHYTVLAAVELPEPDVEYLSQNRLALQVEGQLDDLLAPYEEGTNNPDYLEFVDITILMVLKERLHIERLLITGSYPFPSRQVWHSTGKAGNVK